ncbi:MAG: BatD family protein [Planctomycetes bacterium]|nr:BatD family protein [Planctomycetota bacterium]
MSRRLLIAPLLLGLLTSLAAQERLEIEGPEPATLRLGDTARAVLRVEGRTADPGKIELPEVPGLQLQLSAPSRTEHTFFDGRALTQRVGVQYQLLLRPLQEGSFVVPPFKIWTGTAEQMTRELRVEARKDLRGDEFGYLEVQVEPRRVYVHEPVRIRVEFGVQQKLRIVEDVFNMRYRYLDVEVQAPWLDSFPGGEQLDVPAPEGNRQIVMLNRTLLYAAVDNDHLRDGQRWQQFVFEKAFLPTRLGRIELSAPMLRYQVLTGAQRDVFGGTRRQSDNLYSYGKPIELEVLPIPEAGRPDPYYGAVGRFTLDATADRSTVKVGDSVKLTLTVRGRGNLEFLRLPPLDELPGFHKLGQKEAPRTAEQVQVTYDFTPLSTEVTQMPAIDWNFFDTTPGVEKFVAVRTEPIPLKVLPLANGETLAPLPDAAPKAVTPGVDDIFDLPALDGPPALPERLPAWGGWVAVLAPWLLVLLGRGLFVRWRRRAADRSGQRARAAARRCEQALQRGDDPSEALAAYLGDRLDVPSAAVIRPDLAQELERAGLPVELGRETAACLEQGLAARYGGGGGLQAAPVRELLRRLEQQRFGVLLLPLLLSLVVGGLTAQVDASGLDKLAPQDPMQAAVAAYRAGDYATAEASFAAGFASTGDYRCWQARGNCFFRMGRLPEARWAYETAALARPRDPELLADLRLVRQRLGVDDDGAGFTAQLLTLRDWLTPGERAWVAALLMACGAGCLVLGWRRVGWRWLGVLVLLPGCIAALEVLWLGPARPPNAIALQKVEVVAEPRAGLQPVATVRAGVALPVLGGGEGAYVRVQVGARTGFVRREQLGLVR